MHTMFLHLPKRLFVFVGILLCGCLETGRSQSLIEEVEDAGRTMEPDFTWIPFGFFNDTFGTAVGVGGVYSHVPAPESSLLGAVTLGTTGSFNLAVGGSQLRLPGTERLFLYPLALFARYQDQDLYIGSNNPGFADQRAGSHDSDPDNVYEATLWDIQVETEFRYLLPIGEGRGDRLINTYVVEEGQLLRGASGGSSWNPLESGRTFLLFTPGYRKKTVENEEITAPLETLNVEIGLLWDNRDFPFNPSTGGHVEMTYQRDVLDDTPVQGWSSWEFQAGRIFDVGGNRVAGQRVLAFDLWSAYSPSWETDEEGKVTRRPPPFEGPTLGGFYHLRGYDSNRFQDKAALAYTAEYRIIPSWQPLEDLRLLSWAKPRYWQWVLFGEAGRVASHWDIDTLHTDMNLSGGVSLRGMFYQAVCRLDIAFSDEGTRIVAMYGHPF